MSLRTAIEKIVEEMNNDIQNQEYSPDVRFTVKVYRNMLEMALTASKEEESKFGVPPIPSNPNLTVNPYNHPLNGVDPGILHRLNIEAAKSGIRIGQDKDVPSDIGRAEQSESDMCLLHGGPDDGDYYPVPSHMPIGAHTVVRGRAYTRMADGLHLNDNVKVTNGD